ncbi:hypothetical protein JY97_14895 [Alkalispirochaeta odontotermitis]|nr:hypothetical protein JY97_14895 [Alkalispirochaeta odontotermitis]
MKIIISSGGTEESIDSVRKISNFSTGKTGAHLASYFASRDASVTLIRSQNATSPVMPEITEHSYQSYYNLRNILHSQLSGKHWDAIIHLAAVSDYIVERIQVDEHDFPIGGHGKIPSGHKILLHLRPTEKILDSLRAWSLNKSICIVAFKLTPAATSSHTAPEAKTLSEQKTADYIVHNNLPDIKPQSHPVGIWKAGKLIQRTKTKDELAQVLYELLVREKK